MEVDRTERLTIFAHNQCVMTRGLEPEMSTTTCLSLIAEDLLSKGTSTSPLKPSSTNNLLRYVRTLRQSIPNGV